MPKVEVNLVCLTGCGLVVPFPTGVVYCDTTDLPEGIAAVEGYFVPIDLPGFCDVSHDDFSDVFNDPDMLDSLIARSATVGGFTLTVDREKFAGMSTPGWVWARIAGKFDLAGHGDKAPDAAVLVWRL